MKCNTYFVYLNTDAKMALLWSWFLCILLSWRVSGVCCTGESIVA
jgi:hypothetical protein